ncbi:MAG: hypothetical protein ABSD20_06465 [Terriglobales bacterium]
MRALEAASKDNLGFLAPLHNARFVYVTSFDGSEYSHNPLPEDRRAIDKVQGALAQDSHYTIVYRAEQADMIVAVESRPSEDILAVYDRRSWRDGNYLWRSTEKAGFADPDQPLVKQLQDVLQKVNGTQIDKVPM